MPQISTSLIPIDQASLISKWRQLQKTTTGHNATMINCSQSNQPHWLHLQHNSCTQGSGKRSEPTERLSEPEDQEVCGAIVSPRNDREATLRIPQQYGCLNKTWAMAIPMDRLRDFHEVEISWNPTPRQRTG